MDVAALLAAGGHGGGDVAAGHRGPLAIADALGKPGQHRRLGLGGGHIALRGKLPGQGLIGALGHRQIVVIDPLAVYRLPLAIGGVVPGPGQGVLQEIAVLHRVNGQGDGVRRDAAPLSSQVGGVQGIRGRPIGQRQPLAAGPGVGHGDGPAFAAGYVLPGGGNLGGGEEIVPLQGIQGVGLGRQGLPLQGLPAAAGVFSGGEAPQIQGLPSVHGHGQGRLAAGAVGPGQVPLRQGGGMGLIPQPVQKDAVPLCRDKAGNQRDKGADSRNKKGQSGQHRLPPQPLPGQQAHQPAHQQNRQRPAPLQKAHQPQHQRRQAHGQAEPRPPAAQGQRRDSAGEDRQGQHQGPDAAAAGIGQVIPPGLQQQTVICQVSQGGCGGGQPVPAQDGPRQPRGQHRRQGRQPSGLFPPDQQAQAQGRRGGGYGENRRG